MGGVASRCWEGGLLCLIIAHEEKAVKAAAAYQLERLSLLHQNSFLPSIAQQTRALPWGGVYKRGPVVLRFGNRTRIRLFPVLQVWV